MIRMKIGGVPEHFNLPWLRALEQGAAPSVAAQWQDFPGGTGVMAAALERGEIDAALLLTEGAIAAIANGGSFKIASLYTETPLVWGIHVPASSELNAVADLRGHRYAISRHGSGSHLMAYVHARQQGWPTNALEFVTVGDLAGARRAFAEGTAEIFFWEKFMTKPLVDSGEFRRIDEFSAPWPAFVLCVAEHCTGDRLAALELLLKAVLKEAGELRDRPDAAALFAERYELERADAAEWFAATRFVTTPTIDLGRLGTAADALAELSLIPAGFRADQAVRADFLR